jgi:hypothetical protein
MRSVLAAVFLFSAASAAAPKFAWIDHKDGRLELTEGGKTALIYNYGPQLRAGAPEDRRRCCYIYPALTPAGVSVLDDFPKDHFHHHGLFWAWPVVETPDGKYDLWMYKGAEHRPVRYSSTTKSNQAVLTAENGWWAGGKQIVKETVVLTAYPSASGAREFDVALTLEAMGAPVTLSGSQENGKSYGGYSARFAPREQTALRADSGPVSKDEDLVPHAWAELEAVYGGKRAALRITPDPANPGTPYQWCLRNYGFVGASFPGRTAAVESYTIQPGKPLKLKFRTRLADVVGAVN